MSIVRLIIAFCFGIWLAINAICALNGADDGQPSSVVHDHEKCHNLTRWTHVFPGYAIGCWMSQPISKGTSENEQ